MVPTYIIIAGNRPKRESAMMIHMDSISLAAGEPRPPASLLHSLHHIVHFTGTTLRFQDDHQELVIEGYSSRMVELARRVVQTNLELQRAAGDRGGNSSLVQQAAIASTSDCGEIRAPVRTSKPPIGGAVLQEEEVVTSTTECEPTIASKPHGASQPGKICFQNENIKKYLHF